MSTSENLTWAFIGIATAAYVTQRHIAVAKAQDQRRAPSAEREVDPTRWRHDGRQPLAFEDGNRRANAGGFVMESTLANALAF
jgi:hypothetical protein